MKKIGMVGGISWSSTIDYYRFLNEEINSRLGGLNFAECILYSVNFDKFQASNAAGDWEETYRLLADAAKMVEKAGADAVLLCANTAHKVAESIQEILDVPLIDIRTATAKAIKAQGLQKVGLLGTVYTMEMDFYRSVLTEANIDTIIPESKHDRDYIEETLLHELGKGIIRDDTRRNYLRIIEQLIANGAQGIILGCTEIPLLISQTDVSIPVFNTTKIHVQAAVDFALGLVVQPATADDLNTIYWLFEQAIDYQKKNNFIGWKSYDKSFLQSDVENGLLFKVTDNGEIKCIFSVCYSDILIWREKEKSDAIYLHRIVVHPSSRGERLFGTVLSWAIEEAKKRQMKYIRMDTWAENERIISYYKDYGFRFIENYTTSATEDLPQQHRNLNVALLEFAVHPVSQPVSLTR